MNSQNTYADQQGLMHPLNRIADVLEMSQSKEVPLSEQDKLRAAYALNLCMVSVSQIIDYADVYVLEQEYTGILNNLNLENMPKDEALLDILRQLLDTITFFRIQNEEKVFIEREYKNKMKTAIWRAMPNCSVILGSGHWVAMLVTLACQIGTGYMNYRNEKAQATFEYDKEMMQLHTAAIEQFNGLRRELFTTAWKLAEKYQFADDWRLTESQISQYNKVLMDTNLHRRLARLEELENNFNAYPPFWYFKGHTALQLSERFPEESEQARIIAKAAFRRYFDITATASELLRTDPIGAACALEYAALLDTHAHEKRIGYVRQAIRKAGHHYDILQLCVTAYLDFGETDLAADLLRYLVCESYNEHLNAQLLSAIYIEKYLQQPSDDSTSRDGYDFLCKIIPANELLPWPAEGTDNVQSQYLEFIGNRRNALLESYAEFFVRYYSFKSKECHICVNTRSDQREHALIEFAEFLYEELASLPCVELDHAAFVRCIAPRKDEIERIVKSGKCTNRNFETVFGDVFLSVAQSIAQAELSTMEQVSQLEVDLGRVVGKYAQKVAAQNTIAEQKDYTIRNFLNVEDDFSESHKKIKERIKARQLLNEGARHSKLLLSGEHEFYRYIKRSKLDGKQVIAVINDNSAMDCDLIFTENGLVVRERQSGFAVGAKYALLGPLALIDDGVHAILPHEVAYNEAEYKDNQLQKPRYRNNDVNMEMLFQLIEEIRGTCVDNSIEHRISSSILGLSAEN